MIEFLEGFACAMVLAFTVPRCWRRWRFHRQLPPPGHWFPRQIDPEEQGDQGRKIAVAIVRRPSPLQRTAYKIIGDLIDVNDPDCSDILIQRTVEAQRAAAELNSTLHHLS